MAASETYRLSVEYGAIPLSTVVVSPAERSEFERFEDPTSKLVAIPKTDADKKGRKKSQKKT
jgi:hypothetical protein